ncbi:MAG: hypothetical protein IPI67_12900 [Myxococcales bacterium]|nr:hypothetical protein [Myxococcales bacterium]
MPQVVVHERVSVMKRPGGALPLNFIDGDAVVLDPCLEFSEAPGHDANIDATAL